MLASWGPLGSDMGRFLERLGAFLERLEAMLGRIGQLGDFLRRLGGLLEPSFLVLAPSSPLRAASGERKGGGDTERPPWVAGWAGPGGGGGPIHTYNVYVYICQIEI